MPDLDREIHHLSVLHASGQYEAQYERAKAILVHFPEQPQVLYHLGAGALSTGRIAEGISVAFRAAAAAPGNADNLDLAVQAGLFFPDPQRAAQVLPMCETLIAMKPSDHRGYSYKARALKSLQRLPEAIEAARRAASMLPEHYLLLAEIYHEAGQSAPAMRAAQKALAQSPRSKNAHFTMGVLYFDAGNWRMAELHWQTALGLLPQGYDALHALGKLYLAQGRDADFEAHIQRAGEHPASALLRAERAAARGDHQEVLRQSTEYPKEFPHHALFCHLRGNAWVATGEPLRALLSYLDAMESPSSEPWMAVSAATVAAQLPEVPERFDSFIEPILESELVDTSLLVRPFITRWDRHPQVRAALDSPPHAHIPLQALLREEAVWYALYYLHLTDLRWERLMVRLRDALLTDRSLPILGDHGMATTAVGALLLQSWYGEFAWPSPPEAVVEGREWLRAAFTGTYDESAPIDEFVLLILKEEPAQARALIPKIPTLAMSEDAISAAVQAQYEEHPYPRIFSINRKPPEPLERLLRPLFPHLVLEPRAGKTEILVAGCGTGQQALAAATRYSGAEVLAIDLSRAALAETQRRAARMGLKNLAVAQADILALSACKRRFHLVEAGGVLHHMADPLAGWRVLADLTLPGGWMKIGLYSESGREGVMAARTLLAERGFRPDNEGLRAARALLAALPQDHLAAEVWKSPDFFSLSGLRDLVMHVHEHRYTLPLLRAQIDALGLEFVGFQHANPVVSRWYAERAEGPQVDFQVWEEVERRHPRAFAGMYQFWCRKPE